MRRKLGRGSTSESRRRSPLPRDRHARRCCGEVGAVVDEPLHAALETRQLLERRGSRVSTANSGISPTMRAHLERDRAAVGQVEHVVEEAVLFVPQPVAVVAHVVHGLGDVEEVLEELAGDVLVGGVVARQFQRDGQHVQAVHGHPAGAVGLLDDAAGGQRRRCGRRRRCCPGRGSRPGRRCLPSASLRLTHQVKLSSSLWKTRSRNARSRVAAALRARSCRRARRPRRAPAG